MIMLPRLRIGPALFLGPGAVLVLLLVVSWTAYAAMARQNASLESLIGQRAASLRAELVAADAMHGTGRAFAGMTQRIENLATREEALARAAASRARADFRMIAILLPALPLLALALALATSHAVASALQMQAVAGFGPEGEGEAGGENRPAAASGRRRRQASHLRLVSSRR